MGRKRRAFLIFTWLTLVISTVFTLAAMSAARTLGEAAFMAKSDAVAIFVLAVVALGALVLMLIAILTAPKVNSA